MAAAASPVSSISPVAAYAAEENSPISNIIQTNLASANQEDTSNDWATRNENVPGTGGQRVFQGSTNINEDNDVLIGQCIDGHVQINDNDEVAQTNIQSTNQESDSEDEANDGGIIANKAVQDASQVATNMNMDNDLVIILGCQSGTIEINDNDEVAQTNVQSTNQQSDSEDDEEEDSE
jgi:hypothetical protein